MKRMMTVWIFLVASLASAEWADALLFDRGGGLIYDQDRNITWLADANYAKSSGVDADGLMTWEEANAWAEGLTYGGFDDWRLPSNLNPDGSGPCFGIAPTVCKESEMGHLFYSELEGTSGTSIEETADPDVALFQDLEGAFWSGPEYPINPEIQFFFDFKSGEQLPDVRSVAWRAWAVRDGDVGSASVPEPNPFILIGAGLIAAMIWRRGRTT